MGNGCWFLHSRVDLTTQHILRKVSLFSIEVLSIWQRRHVLRKVHISLSLYNWTNMTCVEKSKHFFNWQVDKQDTCTWNLTNSSAPRLSLLVIAQLLVFKDRESLRLQFLSFCKQSEFLWTAKQLFWLIIVSYLDRIVLILSSESLTVEPSWRTCRWKCQSSGTRFLWPCC